MKKKKIVVALLVGMLFIISGCTIKTSELETDSETSVAENSEGASQEILQEDSTIVETPSEELPVLKADETGNMYFYNEIGDYTYRAKFAECEEVNEAIISVKEVANFNTGILYKLEIICDKQVQDIYGNMLCLGYYFVQRDYIYKIDGNLSASTQTSVDELIQNATLVCQGLALNDRLDENEKGWHEYIVVNGDLIEYHGYSNEGSTNFYENFTWEPEKGLVYYKCGFGAESYGIELTLID